MNASDGGFMNTITVIGAARDWNPTLSLDFGKRPRKMSEDEFFMFCQANRDLRIERNKNGDIEIIAPTGIEGGARNFILNAEFGVWVEKDGTGVGLDSSTGLTLPNGAVRSPDFAWLSREKWNAIPGADRKRFAHVCPDFVVELRSETDTLKKLQAKMEEYIENGVSLEWLIDPLERKVHIYRPDTEIEILDNPAKLYGKPLLKGLVINIQKVW